MIPYRGGIRDFFFSRVLIVSFYCKGSQKPKTEGPKIFDKEIRLQRTEKTTFGDVDEDEVVTRTSAYRWGHSQEIGGTTGLVREGDTKVYTRDWLHWIPEEDTVRSSPSAPLPPPEPPHGGKDPSGPSSLGE